MIGPVIGPADVADAAEATLRLWLPSTLHELGHAKGIALPEPSDYRQVPTADAILAVEDVTLAVACPGVTGDPHKSGRGALSATYVLVVSAFVRGPDYRETSQLVSAYGVAIRTVLLQHPSLGDFASSTTWTAEDVAPVGDSKSARTLQLAAEEFAVVVDGVTDARAGYLEPPDFGPAHSHDPHVLERAHVTLNPRTTSEQE